MRWKRCSSFVLAGLISVAYAGDWNDSLSPHFSIHRQRTFGVSGLTLNVEKIHNRLRMDLAGFSPWMDKERVELYLYADAQSFHEGEFSPPSWSNGLAFYDRKTIVVYEQSNPAKLNQVIAHEMTHLLFESYWGEAHKAPPHWLNEGLAMMEETPQLGQTKGSEWFRAMVSLGPQGMPAVSQVFDIVPNSDLTDNNSAGLWYVASYSLVRFLYAQHTRLQFLNFNRNLRDGKSLQEALWTAYRYTDVARFEAEWRDWVKEQSVQYAERLPMRPIPETSDPGSRGAPSSSLEQFKPMKFEFRKFSFHSLRDSD